MKLPFTKMQGIGNDFVVVEETVWPATTDWSALALRLCDRKFGIGGDGLLVLGASDKVDLRMRMFNPDGTEDMCGNGLRCVVALAHERGTVERSGVAETIDGLHPFRIDAGQIDVEMAAPLFTPADIPVRVQGSHGHQTNRDISIVNGENAIYLDAVNTGSTHAVYWANEPPDDALFLQWSPLIETAPAFPERTSVMWAVVEPPEGIRLRIWERGVGETLGCGTGACAAAVLTRDRGYLETETIRVRSKGGELTVRWSGDHSAPVSLAGPAQIVFSGVVEVNG